MRFVLDASVAVKWVLPEPDSPKALGLRDDVRNKVRDLHAPDTFPIEVCPRSHPSRTAGPSATVGSDAQGGRCTLDRSESSLVSPTTSEGRRALVNHANWGLRLPL